MRRKPRFEVVALVLLAFALPVKPDEKLAYFVAKNDHSIESVCVGVNAGIHPHPDPALCYVFITCTFEQSTAYQCAEGFVFDRAMLRCIPGDRDQCPERTEPDWDQFCSGVSYAFYALPAVCWEFVFCSLGNANRYSCPMGEIWSQREGACLPGNWDTCELLELEISCQNRPDGVLPHPTNCTSFLECNNGQTTISECSRGEVFDQTLERCVAGNTETCVRIDNVCRDKADGTVLAHPNECDLFILCQGGQEVANLCPSGEILNVQAQFCVPGNADTCQFHPVETMCQNASIGAIYPHPNSCTQFVSCITSQGVTTFCPAGQIFHAPSGSCRVGNTNTCELIIDVCEGQADFSVLEHPSICSLFIWCQGGTVTVQPCPNGEILRPDAQFCVPGNQLTCEFDPIDRMCVGQIDSVSFPHPTECAQFVACFRGETLVQTCPKGSVYHASTRSCVPGDDDTCERFDSICSGRPDGIIPHPTTCNAFVYCTSGQAVFEQCGPGTILKQGISGCVVGNTETCTEAKTICTDHADHTLVGHPSECNLIVVCMMQQPTLRSCPAGEIFNSTTLLCIPGDLNTCQVHPVETMCRNRPYGAVYPHPSDCTQFVRCAGEQPNVQVCPAGHVLHHSSMSCRPGDTNTCEVMENVCQNQTHGVILQHPSLCGHFVWCQSGAITINPCPVGEILRPDVQFCVPGNLTTCEYAPIDRMCLGQADHIRFPHPTECSSFVACQGQNGVVQSCPAGSVYSAKARSCTPGNEATCERFENICVGRPESMIAHPNTCTAYIHCSSNLAVYQQCAPGTVFEPSLGGCVVGNTETCTRNDGMCVGQPDGSILTHPNECDLYILCVSQQAAPLRCPPGEILNEQAQICAPGNVTSCQFNPVEKMCHNKINNAIYPHPNDCSRFVQCTDGQGIVKDCPPGEILHGSSRTCRPGNTATCQFLDGVCQGRPDGWVIEHQSLCGHFIQCQQGVASVHSCPGGEILRPDAQLCVPGNPTSCVFDPVEKMCMGRPDGRVYPHPNNCTQYLRCQNSQPTLETCRPGTIFRATTQSCVAGNGDTCTFLDYSCAGRPDGVIPHPEGCALFLLCTSGFTAAFRCPEGEILHPEFLVCAAGNADDCSLAPVTTEPSIISVCEGRPDGNYTHPLLCYLFIHCTKGATEIRSCPKDQIFVGAIRGCAPGNQESCIPL
uniref:Chitin-binding type-2 domain-containing protein n=1 Tax=Anopheles coluzzii TaxID=1518534 RepID=A0A6E8W5G7_ANOCL|nr:multiple epidermal growth factor-like domains protein 6 [Anopheles coluzzii]